MATADAGLSREADDVTISVIEVMRAGGRYADAHECYGDLVRRHQRRAVRIAYRMLRDQADADEVVQDAFVKAYLHLPSFRRELPFEVWFTGILINRCLDRLRARKRRERWVVSIPNKRPRSELSGRVLRVTRCRRRTRSWGENAARNWPVPSHACRNVKGR